MKRLLGLALAAMIAGPAVGADMPVKVKAPPVVYYDWSGVYLGFNIGGVWTEVDRFYPLLNLVGLVPQTFTSRGDDVIFGFHAGAQWQWGQWVAGVEVAYSSGAKSMRSLVSLSPPEPFTTLSADNKIEDLLTVGPQLGYAWDRLLIFATGGYAGAHIHGAYLCTATNVAVLPGPACGVFVPPLSTINGTGHTWNHGWFAGGGIDYMIHKGSFVDVILGVEYQ